MLSVRATRIGGSGSGGSGAATMGRRHGFASGASVAVGDATAGAAAPGGSGGGRRGEELLCGEAS